MSTKVNTLQSKGIDFEGFSVRKLVIKMKLSDKEIKKRARLKEIGKYIREIRKGFAQTIDIESKFRIPHSTLHGYLHELNDIGEIKKYEKDGKNGWAWIDYTGDEDKIKNAHDKLREKFFGEPPLKAVAIEIKEISEKTREFLSKYTYYREPTDEEMEKSAKEIQRYLIWNCWIDQLHERNFKKWGYEKGIEELAYSGINGDIFSNLIKKEGMPSVDEVSNYLKRFPELKVEVNEKKDQKTAYYEFEWSEDAKNLFKMLGSKLKPWEGTGLILLPRRLDISKYNSYMESIDREPIFMLDKIKKLAEYSVPTEEALEDCLNRIRNPDFKNLYEMFPIFRNFCQNAKDCEVLSPEKEEAITEALTEIAFVEEIEGNFNWAALEVLKIFDGELIKDGAKAFFLKTVKKGYKSVNYLEEIAKWICRDPKIKREIMKELVQIISKNSDKDIRNGAKNLLQHI